MSFGLCPWGPTFWSMVRILLNGSFTSKAIPQSRLLAKTVNGGHHTHICSTVPTPKRQSMKCTDASFTFSSKYIDFNYVFPLLFSLYGMVLMLVLGECTEAIVLQQIRKQFSFFMLTNINVLWYKNNQTIMNLLGNWFNA